MAIERIKHRGLRRFFQFGDSRQLHPSHVGRIGRILAALDDVYPLEALSRPDYRLHPLQGDRKGLWAVRVSSNWRIVFRVEGGRVFDVDLMDYH